MTKLTLLRKALLFRGPNSNKVTVRYVNGFTGHTCTAFSSSCMSATSDNIGVVIRVRPLNEKERQETVDPCWVYDDTTIRQKDTGQMGNAFSFGKLQVRFLPL